MIFCAKQGLNKN